MHVLQNEDKQETITPSGQKWIALGRKRHQIASRNCVKNKPGQKNGLLICINTKVPEWIQSKIYVRCSMHVK